MQVSHWKVNSIYLSFDIRLLLLL